MIPPQPIIGSIVAELRVRSSLVARALSGSPLRPPCSSRSFGNRRVIERRICCEKTGDPFALAQVGDLESLLFGEVRCDFDEQGFFGCFPAKAPDDPSQTADFLADRASRECSESSR